MGKKKAVVDPKYVAMLNTAYEKYAKLEVVNSNFEHFSDSNENVKKLLVKDPIISTSSHKIGENSVTKNKKSNSDNKTKKVKNRANYGAKSYSEEENIFLLNYLKNNSDLSRTYAAKELAKLMKGRTWKSIKHQIVALQSGKEVAVVKRILKRFSLTEDKVIIDEAIKHLKLSKSLREATIQNIREFGKIMKRNHKSIYDRWEAVIKCWLLQYYNKNLNQEIRPMLVDTIHRNYDSVLDIDWEFVLCHKEFSGYTIKGLKELFSDIIWKAAKSLKKPSYELTLDEIAIFTEEYFKKTLRVNTLLEKRKMDCIEYFESKISEEKIICSKN